MELFASTSPAPTRKKTMAAKMKRGASDDSESGSDCESESEKTSESEDNNSEDDDEEEDEEDGGTRVRTATVVNRNGVAGGVYSFADAGLCPWICENVASIGYKKPTDIQAACIPSILQGHDVLACAQTGSGKTAAFALPILQRLSEDPYGIYALVLTPTRELAEQIAQQISAFGATFGVRISLVIGGVNMIEQALQLSKRPHFVIATPGRLRHHLQSAAPPDISRAQFLVLDEADRLLAGGFADELEVIISRMGPRRKTLLFSATLTSSLVELEQLALKDALRFDLTAEHKIPERLLQQYLFMPPQIKMCYLVAVLRKMVAAAADADATEELGMSRKVVDSKADAIRALLEDSGHQTAPQAHRKKKKGNRKGGKSSQQSEAAPLPFSVIIFVGSTRRCQELSETLKELDIDNVSLNGLLSQTVRSQSLARFKNQLCKVLVATDVASRGLDIPSVDVVINFDLPKISSDYVHRAGRTARAGRGGRCLSFLTQYDIDMLHSIEEFTGQKLTLSTEVTEDDVPPLLNPISKAMRVAKMKMMDSGSDEKMELIKKRKRKQRKHVLRKQHRDSGGDEIA